MYVNPNDRTSSLKDNAYPTIIDAPNAPEKVTPKRKIPTKRDTMSPIKRVSKSKKTYAENTSNFEASHDIVPILFIRAF